MTSPTAALAALAADVRREGDLSSRSGQMGRLYDIAAKLEALAALPESGEQVEHRLFDGQWVNIVNAPEVLSAESTEEAVIIAVRKTEQAMAENIACGFPKARTPAAPTPGEPT